MPKQATNTIYQPVLHEGLINSFTDYEQNYPVDEYICYDWNCWPLLRIISSYQISIHNNKDTNLGLPSRLASHLKEKALESPDSLVTKRLFNLYRKRLANRKKKELDKVLQHDACHSVRPDTPTHEVVILTQSGRRTKLDNSLFDIYSDPICQSLQKRNLTPMVWEQGTERWPRLSNSAWITRQLAIEAKHVELPLQKHPPEWFLEFASWSKSTHRHDLTWYSFSRTIRLLQSRSRVLEKWLQSCKSKLLISVCWYDPLVMAATLAAKRTGVITVDLQHGMQNNIHSAYTNWNHVPAQPYGLIPDFFWSWGVNDAKKLMDNNAAFRKYSKTVVGGNLWYNIWHDKNDLQVTLPHNALKKAPESGSIAVTLQHGSTNFADRLIEMIKTCSTDWFWMIRMHPATPQQEKDRITGLLDGINQENIDYRTSSTIALYALLGNCDIHITGHSTSALEALGFGVPTITVTENGACAFKEFIENGVMISIKDTDKIRNAIRTAARIPKNKCREYSEKVFAPAAEASRGLDVLLSAANIRW